MTWRGLVPTTFSGQGDYVPSPVVWAGAGSAAVAAAPRGGGSGYTVPAVIAGTHVGVEQPLFSNDFYDRIHVSTRTLALGNVISAQVRELWVWNAWRTRPRTLTLQTLAPADGLTLGGQTAPPVQFVPLQQRTWQLSIAAAGSPTINALLTWQFASGETLTVAITGNRVTSWTWLPDWSEGVLERLEWATDVITAYRSQEQRRSLRQGARRSLEFSSDATGDARGQMEAALWSWGARVWAVPFWPDGETLLADLPIGALSIPATPALRDYRGGGLALLLGVTSRDFETVEIDTVGASALTLKSATLRAWPAGTRVYPARTARLSQEVSVSRMHGEHGSVRVKFDSEEPIDWPALAGLPVYRGYVVLEDRAEWTDPPQLSFTRKGESLDGIVGLRAYDDEAEQPLTTRVHRWALNGRTAIDRLRRLGYLLRGKAIALWTPTWAHDLRMVATVAGGGQNIDVAWIGYTLHLNRDPGRRDLRIETRAGAVHYRRIIGNSELDASTERLTLDTALPDTLAPADIVSIHFISLSRLDSDALEFAWWTGDYADAVTRFRTFRNDV